MPSCSESVNPSGVKITFLEETHKYFSVIDGKQLDYTSGTTFIHRFFPEFDPTGEITKRCAEREGITVDEMKAKWRAKADASCRFGTRTHELCEDIELNREIRNVPEDEKETAVFEHASKMAKKLYDSVDIVGVEKIVFSPDLRIAGTIDLLARSRKDGTYLIIDHKTNSSIDTFNKYKSFGLDPIKHVPDLNFWHYACQLNLYQYLLQRESYTPKDAKFRLFLNHITESGAKLIELPNMQIEIRDMFIHEFIKDRDRNNDIPV